MRSRRSPSYEKPLARSASRHRLGVAAPTRRAPAAMITLGGFIHESRNLFGG